MSPPPKKRGRRAGRAAVPSAAAETEIELKSVDVQSQDDIEEEEGHAIVSVDADGQHYLEVHEQTHDGHGTMDEDRKQIVMSSDNQPTLVLLTHSGEKVGESNQFFTILDSDSHDNAHSKAGNESVVIVTLPQNEDKSGEGSGEHSNAINSEDLSFFHCMICRQPFVSQKEFFHHLKDHYEVQVIGSSSASENAAMPSSPVTPNFTSGKKRGRKSKMEIMAEEKRAILKMKKKAKKMERITRSGRISKPRIRDVDMISSVKVKLEVPDEEEIADEDFLNEIAADKNGEGDGDKDDVEVSEDQGNSSPSKSPVKKSRRIGSYSVTNAKKIKNSDGGPDKYECNVCHKHYANSTSISVHMRIHKGERPYKCSLCMRAFRQYSDLKYHHQSLHNDKKAFQCEFCGKEFSRKYSLNIHQKIHTGIRDYKCDICQKGFRAAIYVQEHRRIHTGEKPFLCDVCGRGFRIKSDMLRHRINVHFKGSKVAAAKNITKEELVEVETPDYILAEPDDDKEEGLTGEPYAAHLVYISDNEAVLVTQ